MKKSVNKEKKNQESRVKKDWIFWTPRILSIIFILFLAVFSLDVFDPSNNYTALQTFLALFMHNIPVFVLAVILWISWKREIVGAVAFILAGLAYIYLTLVRNNFEWYLLSWSFIIAGPAFFIGILFWIGWKRKSRKR